MFLPEYDGAHIRRARVMRRNGTKGEARLWTFLKGRKLGAKFRRQHPIGSYIVDFYCPAARLIIEIDGYSHEGRGRYDLRRQKFLEELGLRVVRFSEAEVCRSLEEVLRSIGDYVENCLKTNPSPSLTRGTSPKGED